MEKQKYKQVKSNEIKKYREKILKEQKGKCAICDCLLNESTGITLDHQHKRKKDPIGLDGGGLIRGVLCRSCNSWEGKIWNNTSRFHNPKNVEERIELLKKLIKYYKKGTYPYIHPSEKMKEPKVSKRNYNKLVKMYKSSNKKGRVPEYPKNAKLTLKLKALFEEFGIDPYN